MAERTLDELKELARPALRHAELVNLARTETPGKAQELASTHWPRRQSKAVRFLAMVRRDYPEAFEAFITSVEHARANSSEHAQGDNTMIAEAVSNRPLFLYPTSKQFPFDEVCGEIVRALEARNWQVPGVNVKFDVYGTGAQKFRMVREITGADFRIYFSRKQKTMTGGRWNDTAAVNSITIPQQAIHVYEDESGPTYSIYVGENWEADRDWFFKSSGYGVNSKLNSEPRKYLKYKGAWSYPARYSYSGRRAPLLVHDDDLNREYSPEPLRRNMLRKQKPHEVWAHIPENYPEKKPTHDAPMYVDTQKVMTHFTNWLRANVLEQILVHPAAAEVVDAFVEPVATPFPTNIGPFFTFGEWKDAERINKGREGKLDELEASDHYGLLGTGYRLVSLGVSNDGTFPEKAYDGFEWCGIGEVQAETPIDSLDVHGHYRWSDRERFVIRVSPKSADNVYIADWAAYDKARNATFEGKPDDFRASDAQLGEWHRAAARTFTPITQYQGNFEKPVVLISRELGFDEVEVVSGPWADRHGR